MTGSKSGSSTGVAAWGCPSVQWNDSLDAVLEHLALTGCDEVVVMQEERPIGHLTRAAIERLRRQGNWIGCITAADAMDRCAA